MLRRTVLGALLAVTCAVSLTACIGDPADPPLFGYRQNTAGDLVIAYPICPGSQVAGASIVVRAPQKEKKYTFRTLWSAHDAVSPQVKSGLFTVGAKASFSVEDHPPTGRLPDGFYVDVKETPADASGDGREGWIALSRLKDGTALKPGEYMTSKGKAMTRGQINKQLRCHNPAS